MAVFLLVRHAITDFVDIAIAGRMANVHLNSQGIDQAEALARRFIAAPIRAIVSSPLERARETAAPLSRRLRMKIRVSELINEVDFGEWTGCRIDTLVGLKEWQKFNLFRSGARIPGGESMAEVQKRVVAQFEDLRTEFKEGAVALVTHGDVIRVAVAYYAGIPLDLFTRITVDPASITAVSVNEHGAGILRLNDTGDFSGWMKHIVGKSA